MLRVRAREENSVTMEQKRYTALAPPMAQSGDEVKGVAHTVEQIKALVNMMYREVTFLPDGERSGYHVIRCKDFQVHCNVSQLQAEIQQQFGGLHVLISLNMMKSEEPIVEIAVPRDIAFGFADKYTKAQQVRLVLGVLAVVLSAIFLYLTVFHAPPSSVV